MDLFYLLHVDGVWKHASVCICAKGTHVPCLVPFFKMRRELYRFGLLRRRHQFDELISSREQDTALVRCLFILPVADFPVWILVNIKTGLKRKLWRLG